MFSHPFTSFPNHSIWILLSFSFLKTEGDSSPPDFSDSLFMVETHQLLILCSFIYIILIKIIYINIFSSQFSTNHSFLTEADCEYPLAYSAPTSSSIPRTQPTTSAKQHLSAGESGGGLVTLRWEKSAL